MRSSELEESAADELKRKLPSLSKTDYDTIDRLMRRISKRHHITGKKLHDMFVSKYKHTPDHWIKKYKEKLEEAKAKGEPIFALFVDGKPATKYVDKIEAKNDLEYLIKKYPNKKIELRLHSEAGPSDSGLIGEGEENFDEEQIHKFIKWASKVINLKQPYPKFIFSSDTEKAQAGHHTGVHSGDTIWVYIGNRNLIDIFRTVFHELVHHRQSQLGMIKPGDSYPGSPIEAMADMLAGKYIKIYGKDHPEIFQ